MNPHTRTLKERISTTLGLIAGLIIVATITAILVLSPFAFGLLWYHFVHEPISSAIIGIVCGITFDLLLLVLMQ